jgi:hypothetical protein
VADVRPAALIELDEVAIAPVPAGDVAPAPAV